MQRREEYVQALIQEVKARILQPNEIQTIYFGGGTPSLLSAAQTSSILSAMNSTNAVEITLEANPCDLTEEKLRNLRAIGINRLSIGIQSFRDEELQLLGRRHNAQEAREAVRLAKEAGFDNISIDLMYSLPNQSMADWQYNIHEALQLGIQHISCYCLTYEPNTRLMKLVETNEISPLDEDTENAMYDTLCGEMAANGFVHYEVSNFALPNRQSIHNSSYWNDTPYIGLGAGAHSYNGTLRRWNMDDLSEYIKRISSGEQYWEEEVLSNAQKEMEHIMLGLRTKDGIEITDDLLNKAKPYLNRGQLVITNNRLHATQQGLHLLNRIIEALS